MTNEAGAPVPNALLSMSYAMRQGDPVTPTCGPGACWFTLQADGSGFYSFEFAPGPSRTGWLGVLQSLNFDYESNVQTVSDGANAVVVDMRLRDIRLIAAGQRVAVEVGPDSTRCNEPETPWVSNDRCEVVRVVADRPGCLVVAAQDTSAPGDVPQLFLATSGNYGSGVCRSEPGTWAIAVLGGTYGISFGMPDGIGLRRFDVSTSLQ